MTKKTRQIGLIAALSIGLMGAAHAQDSAVIDVSASINDPVDPISLTSMQSMSFGRVNKPAGADATHTCLYSVGVNSANTVSQQSFYWSDSGAPEPVIPGETRGGCGTTFNNPAQVGYVQMLCAANEAVDLSIQYKGGGVAGTTLLAPHQDIALYVSRYGETTPVATTTGQSLSVTCEDGGMDVWVGGALLVGANASAATDITVGTIALEASY